MCNNNKIMSKETTKENHYHNINGLKGRDIQAKMVELVDGDNWTEKDIHHFYCSSGSSQPQGGQVPKAAVKMQPAPTTNQPGNALVKIRNKAAKWSDLEPVVKNEKFPESRERYLDTPIDKNSFERESVKAHVLLDYEVARRKPMTSSDGFYPLTRSQVEEGISAAISHPDQDYSEKVDHMMDMFKKGTAANNYKGRKSAQRKLVGDDLIESMGKLSIERKEK